MHRSCREYKKHNFPTKITLLSRGVRNPMKILDIDFLKTEPKRTDLKIQKSKTWFPRFSFQKNDFSGLGTVFHVVSFTIHLAAC